MPNSFAQTQTLPCPQCGRALTIATWLILDAGEHPDLLARARTGDLHAVICPACGPLGRIDAPLLIYLPDRDPAIGQPPLIFSPSQQSSAEQDQQMAGGLLQMLAQGLGDAWQDAWLGEIATVQRELLPVALSDDPAAAMAEFSTQRRGDAEARGEDDEHDDELPPAVAAALEAVLRQLADDGVTVESPEDLEQALAARPDLRARLEAAMREISPDDNPGISEDSGIVPDEDLPALINRFLAADTWDESQRIVEAHPALLSDAADEHFALALEEYADNPDAVAMLNTHRALLRRCREADIARAFAEQMLPPEELLARNLQR